MKPDNIRVVIPVPADSQSLSDVSVTKNVRKTLQIAYSGVFGPACRSQRRWAARACRSGGVRRYRSAAGLNWSSVVKQVRYTIVMMSVSAISVSAAMAANTTNWYFAALIGSPPAMT